MALSTEYPPTWESAFETHSLPALHSLSVSLRQTLTANATAQRSLVGSRYRELLSTAERIVTMADNVERVEELMGTLGRGCSAGMVERKARGLAKWKDGRVERGGEAEALVRGRVVRSLVDGAGRLGKRGRGGHVLAAGKDVVLARLIVKSMEKTGEASQETAELGKRVNGARKRLLRWIEKVVGRKDEGRQGVVRALTAYTLVVSAAPKEVLRFFLQVRLGEVERRAEAIESGKKEDGLVGVLDTYAQTLVDVKSIFPRKLTDALSALEKTTLVQDPDVRAMEGLSLDVYEKWIPEDVRNFHPYVRHEQLTTAEVSSGLAAWTKQAQTTVLQGIHAALESQIDVDVVLRIRQQVLSKYISLSTQLRNEQHTRAIESVRSTFLARLSQLTEQAAELPDLTSNLPHSSASPPSVWALHSTSDLDSPAGASRFRQAILTHQHGHSSATQNVSVILDSWSSNIQTYTAAIAGMKAIKWANDLDLDLDDLTDAEGLHHSLSQEDPKSLEERLQTAVAKNLNLAYEKLEASCKSSSSQDPALTLRMVREVGHRRRALVSLLTAKSSTSSPSTSTPHADESFIASLHRSLASSVISRPIQRYKQSLASSALRNTSTLWDGTPPLPVQLSTCTFRFLRDLHREMADKGTDLWSRDAVLAAKRGVERSVGEELAKIIYRRESVEKGGMEDAQPQEQGSDGAEAEAKDVSDAGDAGVNPQSSTAAMDSLPSLPLLQILFDIFYLQSMLHDSATEASASPSPPQSNAGKNGEAMLASLAETCLDRAKGNLDTAAKDRLMRSAKESWRRTYLLFGLLAG
ncbi:unnamed protein product [Zymoseptoria tritici ST99CH_3D7]|uniref:Conserved oligomeric Golgi complex subunit 1 n=1 Tax=Zymoseptoria tritici (strain ST99CH_3D7) TaxID=1276538 RepID=A0A1X7RLG4_ZYMT9|nr:unnamed protein product [Zymoseptoria tritici ST99CH_3D7]